MSATAYLDPIAKPNRHGQLINVGAENDTKRPTVTIKRRSGARSVGPYRTAKFPSLAIVSWARWKNRLTKKAIPQPN